MRGPAVAPVLPTTATVGRDGFLALGAAVGAVGWTVTVAVTLRPGLVPDPTLVVVGVWAVLVGVMGSVGAFATPDAVRFSRPLLGFAAANGTASVATLLAVGGVLPPATHAVAWALAGAVGYGLAARSVDADAATYATAAVLDALVAASVLLGGATARHLAVVGICHVVPLVAVSRGWKRGPALVAGTVAVVLVAFAALVG